MTGDAKITGARQAATMRRAGGGGGVLTPGRAPPDLPSLLLDARIVYIGMPLVASVTELVISELLWLNYNQPEKPVYLYLNSVGSQSGNFESVGFETEAYAILDTMQVRASARRALAIRRRLRRRWMRHLSIGPFTDGAALCPSRCPRHLLVCVARRAPPAVGRALAASVERAACGPPRGTS